MKEQRKPNPIQIEKHLKGIHFPTDRGNIVEHAKQHGAPENIIGVLQHIPDKQYKTAADVAKGIGQVH